MLNMRPYPQLSLSFSTVALGPGLGIIAGSQPGLATPVLSLHVDQRLHIERT